MSTGDELVQSGDSRKVGQISDSNRPMLAALCHQQGAQVTDYGIIRDDQVKLTSAWREALDHCDVIISSGGASDGVEDHRNGQILINTVFIADIPHRHHFDNGHIIALIACPGDHITQFIVINAF